METFLNTFPTLKSDERLIIQSDGVKVYMTVFCFVRTQSLYPKMRSTVSFVILEVQTQSREE